MNYLGNHLLVEMYDCNRQIINDLKKVEELLLESVKISKANALTQSFHKFSPHGVSGVVVISESHFSIHTWPEYGYCALDIFTCGSDIESEKALDFLKAEFGALSISVTEMKRGILNYPVKLLHKPEVSKDEQHQKRVS
jgi:S-adenosylmethionine decarboxylase